MYQRLGLCPDLVAHQCAQACLRKGKDASACALTRCACWKCPLSGSMTLTGLKSWPSTMTGTWRAASSASAVFDQTFPGLATSTASMVATEHHAAAPVLA